jgi:hypothetical protein
VSTDGQVLWWDTRKLNEPTESLLLDPEKNGTIVGGTVLDFETTMPTKFMVILIMKNSFDRLELKMDPYFYVIRKLRTHLRKLLIYSLVIMDLFMLYKEIHFSSKTFYLLAIGKHLFGLKMLDLLLWVQNTPTLI